MTPSKTGKETRISLKNAHIAVFNFSIGVWLILLYPVLIWCVVGTLSAHGFQDKVRQITDPEGNPLSMPTIIRLADQLKDIEEQISRLQVALYEKEAEEVRLKSKRLTKKEKLDEAEAKIRPIFSKLTYRFKQEGYSVNTDAGIRFNILIEMTSGNPTLRDWIENDEELAPVWKSYQESITLLESAEGEYNAARTNQESAREEKEVIAKKISLQQQMREDLLRNAKTDDIVNELNFMRAFEFDLFATMPSQHLTLILTLCMGALGSLIYITQNYLFEADRTRPFSWYFFRPFLGMVTAVAIFILAKAGQITISDVSLTEGMSENLNPYFISFLAIVSGLLSESAIHRIQSAGIMVFRSQDRPGGDQDERWAVGLKEAMTAQNKNARDLVVFLDKPLEDIEEWIEETAPVPPEAQKVISGWLGIPARRLFTDLKPLSEVKESKPVRNED